MTLCIIERRAMFAALLVAIIVFATTTAHAVWPSRGLPVMVAPGWVEKTAAAHDGAGGAIIVSEMGGIFAQRVDRVGNLLWPSNVPVSTVAGNPSIVYDDAGGAIVVWGGIYAQRLDGAGTPLWTADGIPIAPGQRPSAIPSGTGGVVVAWNGNGGMRLQRVDASGALLWGPDGVLAGSTGGDDGYFAPLVSDGEGGFIVAYQTYEEALYGNRLQRVDADGNLLWSTNGVHLTPTPAQELPALASDGAGGAIAVWSDWRNASPPENIGTDLFAQRVDESGAVAWDPNGVAVSVAPSYQQKPVALSDGAGGMIVAWLDDRHGGGFETRVWGQRIAADGTMLWAPDGIELSSPVDPTDSDQSDLRIAPGIGDNVILVWEDDEPYAGYGISAQRVDANGTTYWGQEGIRVYNGVNTTVPQGLGAPAVAAQDGYAIVVTTDRQFTDYDVFGQRIDLVEGEWGAPEPNFVSVTDNPGDQGGRVVVAWTASQLDVRPQRVITQYTVWRSPPGAGLWQAVGASPARYSEFYSLVVPTPADSSSGDPAVFEWVVRSHGVDSLTFWTSPVASGYSVDNLMPGAPTALAADRRGSDVVLEWTAPGDDDVIEFRVYRASAPGVNVISSTLAGVSNTHSFTDANAPLAAIYYAVVAVDDASNASPLSNEIAVAGDPARRDVPPTPEHLALLPNLPNPFSLETELRIGMPRTGEVLVEVFDVAGRRVASRRVAGLRAGWQAVIFDGRNDAGRLLPSGIYFCRATAGSETVTRKMVITR